MLFAANEILSEKKNVNAIEVWYGCSLLTEVKSHSNIFNLIYHIPSFRQFDTFLISNALHLPVISVRNVDLSRHGYFAIFQLYWIVRPTLFCHTCPHLVLHIYCCVFLLRLDGSRPIMLDVHFNTDLYKVSFLIVLCAECTCYFTNPHERQSFNNYFSLL